MMKKIIFAVVVSIFLISSPILADVNSSIKSSDPPLADIYKEGIYHFSQGSGKNLDLKLTSPNKPMILMIIENDTRTLKYYIEFTKESPEIKMYLAEPLSEHTTIIVGEGELIFIKREYTIFLKVLVKILI